MGNFVYDGTHHFSGSPQERAADIMNFFADSEVSAIIATGGGCGAQTLLPYLNYDIISQNPKPIIGFSDITALQKAVFAQTKIGSVAGIMLKFDFQKQSSMPEQPKAI